MDECEEALIEEGERGSEGERARERKEESFPPMGPKCTLENGLIKLSTCFNQPSNLFGPRFY